MKKEKLRFLIGVGFFLLFIGTTTLGFSQYQTIGDDSDSLSVTEGDLREIDNDQPVKYQHKTDQKNTVKPLPSSPENVRDGLTHRYKPAQKRE